MSHAIYLSQKAANKSALIFIKTNCHNKKAGLKIQMIKVLKRQNSTLYTLKTFNIFVN